MRTTQRGKPILRVVSTVPYSQAVVRGTGGYSGIPPFGPGSALHLWGSSKGMKFHQLRGLARKIAANGTEGESGNIVGNPRHDGGPKDWLTVALQEASR